MYLRVYLSRERISVTQFAKDLGFSRSHIQGLCTGRYKASSSLANKIMDISGGLVTPRDLNEAHREFHQREKEKCFDRCRNTRSKISKEREK